MPSGKSVIVNREAMPTSSQPVRPQKDLPMWLKIVVAVIALLVILGMGYVLIVGGAGSGAGLNF